MKRLLIVLLNLLFITGLLSGIDKEDIKRIYNSGKYGILLEKTLNILNINEKNISKNDKLFLYYYIGLAYLKNNNTDMALSYFLKIEKESEKSELLKLSYVQLVKLYKNNLIKKLIYLKKLSSEYPKTKEAFDASIELGKYYLKRRKFNYAINIFEKIVNEWGMGDSNPEVYILLTLSYSGTDAYLDALDYLRIAKKKIPKLLKIRADYLFEASKIYFNTQNYKDSTDGFRRFLNIFPKDKRKNEVLLYLSKSLMKEKKYHDAAIIMIEGLYKNRSLRNYRSLENKKKYFSLLLNLTQSLIKLKESERKLLRKKYKSFTDIDKNLNEIKNKSINYNERRTATVLLNNKYLRNGDIEGAIRNYFYFLKKKGDPYIRKKFREYLNKYVLEIRSEKDMSKILKLWLLVKPRKSYMSGKNLIVLAENLVEIGFLKNAEDVYNHIVKYTLYKKFWQTARNQVAKIRYRNGEYEEFLSLYGGIRFAGKEKKDKEYEFLYYKINSLEKLGKTKKLEKILETVNIKDITSVYRMKIVRLKANMLAKKRKISEAIKLYENIKDSQFIKRSRKNYTDSKLADLYYLSDRLDEALKEYGKLEKSGKNLEWTLFQKVNIFRKKKDDKNAKSVLEKLQKLSPDSFWLKQLNKVKK